MGGQFFLSDANRLRNFSSQLLKIRTDLFENISFFGMAD
jgi:hypothetical protein